jgi:F-type H+-transporting ATPase subunit b
MPQIDQILETYASQIFWLVIVFGLIYFGIGKAMLPKISGTVDARDRKIADDLAEAQRARARADEIEEAYRAGINEARTAAQKAAQEAKASSALVAEKRIKAADAELAAKTAAAEASLKTAQAEALAGIEEVATEAAQDIVAKVSGGKITKAAASKAVKAALANG